MRSSTKSAIHFTLYALICVLVAGSAFVAGYAARAAQTPVSKDVAAFAVFWEAWDIVDGHYYGDTSDVTGRTHGAIKGSLDALEDRYTIFIEPRQREREQEELRGSFGGIGAWIERLPDGRIILTPMGDDRPSAKAGILAGDELIAVEDIPITPETSFDDILALVRGQVGEVVRLTIRREGHEALTFDVKREEIVTPSITWELKTPDIGYVRLSMFNERTNDELQEALQDLEHQGAASYIIDLRNNGGGLLTAAIDVASQFVEGDVVMYERDSDGGEKSYPVKKRGIARDVPVVFLVNGGTASASEIVAGAIQDYERGKLIGTKTYGKASVQLLFDLSDGSSIHVTNAHWLTPDRQEIDGVGLTPDIEVEITDEDRANQRDPQLDRAIAYLQGSSQQVRQGE